MTAEELIRVLVPGRSFFPRRLLSVVTRVINEVIEKSAVSAKPLYMTFIDYENAFDSVDTAAVLEALNDQGRDYTYIRLLDDIYKECTGRIILHKKSKNFSSEREYDREYHLNKIVHNLSGEYLQED